MLKDRTIFIKTGLEEAGYRVSDCVNVIGRTDVLENAKNYVGSESYIVLI